MHNFRRFLNKKAHRAACPPPQEVIDEIANHLEERVEAELQRGADARTAIRAALREAGDWNCLWTEIATVRGGTMTERAKQILIPGAVALLLASVGERLVWWTGLCIPHAYHYWSWITVTAPMTAVFLTAGAVGAACSFRAGGSPRQRLSAATFPAFTALVLFVVLFVSHLVTRTLNGQPLALQSLGGAVLRHVGMGILLPAAVLLVGGLPFALLKSRRGGTQPLSS